MEQQAKKFEFLFAYESTKVSTNLGRAPLSASSLDRATVWASVGTLLVRRSQSMLSGIISFPPGAGGRTF
jgi:hypothetical protein